MIEARGRAREAPPRANGSQAALDALAEEMATYHVHQAELLREHEGQYVLIKGSEVVGVFHDRSAALREGYQRFGIIPFLVRQIAACEPVVYLPNVVA
jgi:hypothetical protein